MVQMMLVIRFILGGESISSIHKDSRWLLAKAAASCCSKDPSVVKLIPLATWKVNKLIF